MTLFIFPAKLHNGESILPNKEEPGDVDESQVHLACTATFASTIQESSAEYNWKCLPTISHMAYL